MQKAKPFDNCQICGSTDLYLAYDENTFRLNQICNKCCSVHYLVTVPPNETFEVERDNEYDVGKAPDDIDDSLMDIEYEVANLPRYATNKDELEQLERIRDIFNELISVIRRMK